MLVSVVFFFSSNHTHTQPQPRLSSSKIMSWRYHLKLIKITVKNTNGFSDLISDAVFGFSYLTYLGSGFSSIWAAITRLHWSRIAAKRKCYREECVKNQLKYRRAPFPRVGGREGTATRRVRLSTEHCQSFFINATSKLVTKLQATRDWLIQYSNRISNFSGLSSQMEMLD